MKIYKISTHVRPPGGRFKHYATLNCDDADRPRIDTKLFRGRPYPEKWRRVALYFDHPNWPRADFYNLSIGKFVCNEKARRVCGPALNKDGEFLPVTIENERGSHFIYNVVCSGPFLDADKSIWEYYERKKERESLVATAFHATRFSKEKVFKIPEDYFCDIYSVERTGEASDSEFRALVEQHKLTGLSFQLVWTEQEGPVKPEDYFVSSGFKLRTGDQKLMK